MKKNLTELVFILDKSGSMHGFEKDTIGGFNATVNKQKEEAGEAIVSTVLFDDTCQVVHDRVSLDAIRPMTEKDYRVGGCTALLDAIGGAIHHIGNVHKYVREEDRPEHTVFIITTDGMENASHRFGSEKVKAMIKERQEEYGWEFLFLAANIDAVETAASMGIRRERAAEYRQTPAGVDASYCAMSSMISRVRKNTARDADLGAILNEEEEKK